MCMPPFSPFRNLKMRVHTHAHVCIITLPIHSDIGWNHAYIGLLKIPKQRRAIPVPQLLIFQTQEDGRTTASLQTLQDGGTKKKYQTGGKHKEEMQCQQEALNPTCDESSLVTISWASLNNGHSFVTHQWIGVAIDAMLQWAFICHASMDRCCHWCYAPMIIICHASMDRCCHWCYAPMNIHCGAISKCQRWRPDRDHPMGPPLYYRHYPPWLNDGLAYCLLRWVIPRHFTWERHEALPGVYQPPVCELLIGPL